MIRRHKKKLGRMPQVDSIQLHRLRKVSLWECRAFAAFIAAMVYVFALTQGNNKYLFVVQGLFILWVAITVVVNRQHTILSTYGFHVFLILGIVLSSNLLFNFDNYEALGKSLVFVVAHVAGILAFVFAAQWAAVNLRPDLILQYLAWILAPLAIWVVIMGSFEGSSDRLTPMGVHPNWWGEMAFGLVVCALAVRLFVARTILILVALLLMYIVQSRGALLASFASIIVYWVLRHMPLDSVAARRLIVAGIAFLFCIVFIWAMGWWSGIWNYIDSNILLLSDPYRGLGTGLTGRLEGWMEATQIFLENPVVGQGFDTLSHVHNGYLRWAGEGGGVLFGVMLVMLVTAIIRAWRQKNDLVVAALLGIVIYLMTYPRALNLNLVGLIFLLALFPWRRLAEGNRFIKIRALVERE